MVTGVEVPVIRTAVTIFGVRIYSLQDKTHFSGAATDPEEHWVSSSALSTGFKSACCMVYVSEVSQFSKRMYNKKNEIFGRIRAVSKYLLSVFQKKEYLIICFASLVRQLK